MFERKSYGPFPPRNYRLSATYQYYIIVLLKLIFYRNALKKKEKNKGKNKKKNRITREHPLYTSNCYKLDFPRRERWNRVNK